VSAVKRGARSLRDFAGGQERATCKMCRLPASVREQIRTRNTRRIKVDAVLAWLKSEHGANITLTEYTKHANGGHERGNR
jgi:hypothetical protein